MYIYTERFSHLNNETNSSHQVYDMFVNLNIVKL